MLVCWILVNMLFLVGGLGNIYNNMVFLLILGMGLYGGNLIFYNVIDMDLINIKIVVKWCNNM